MSAANVEHSDIEFIPARLLRNHLQPNNVAWVLGGDMGICIRRNPDRIRAADVAVVAKTRPPTRPKAYLPVAPDLAVEIVSLTDGWADIRQKVAGYFSIGVERVWVVEPDNQAVRGEGLLAGFEVPVATLLGE